MRSARSSRPFSAAALAWAILLEDRKTTQLVVPALTGVQTISIFHTFANMSAFGVIGPEQFYAYPDTLKMPWLELQQPRLGRGMFFGAHDPLARYKVLHLEMLPGAAGNRSAGNWPRSDELGGLPAGVKIAMVHMPYQPAGQSFQAAPVVVRAHDGDWTTGTRVYGDWLASQFDLAHSRDSWSRRTVACQECRGVPFHELPHWAEAGARSGVKELLVLGWSQADVVPRFEPDTRLGTRDELAAAVRRCHELGVRVTLDLRIPPVPIDHEWYRKELERYACRDRWGIITTRLGWGRAGTLTEQFGTAEQRAILNPAVPGFRQILEGQIPRSGGTGYRRCSPARRLRQADGLQSCHGQNARPRKLGRCSRMHRRSFKPPAVPGERDFSVDVDPVWDRVLPLSMASSPEAGNPSALQTAVPWLRPTFQVAEPDDFTVVNEAGLAGGRLRHCAIERRADGRARRWPVSRATLRRSLPPARRCTRRSSRAVCAGPRA